MVFYSSLFQGALNLMNLENDVSTTCGKVTKALNFPSLPERDRTEWVDWFVCFSYSE